MEPELYHGMVMHKKTRSLSGSASQPCRHFFIADAALAENRNPSVAEGDFELGWTADLIGFRVLTTITNSRSRPHGLQPRLRSTTPGRRPFSRKDSRQRSK